VVCVSGNVGSCGQVVCCQRFLKTIQTVGTELIFDQQLTHRGIDRLLGLCGRLKCCLLYEEALYKELASSLPAIGSEVKTPHGKGRVVERYILKESLVVEIEGGTLVEVPLKDIR
jgi:cell fate regulator YaaT (PSP1 superfamily)